MPSTSGSACPAHRPTPAPHGTRTPARARTRRPRDARQQLRAPGAEAVTTTVCPGAPVARSASARTRSWARSPPASTATSCHASRPATTSDRDRRQQLDGGLAPRARPGHGETPSTPTGASAVSVAGQRHDGQDARHREPHPHPAAPARPAVERDDLARPRPAVRGPPPGPPRAPGAPTSDARAPARAAPPATVQAYPATAICQPSEGHEHDGREERHQLHERLSSLSAPSGHGPTLGAERSPISPHACRPVAEECRRGPQYRKRRLSRTTHTMTRTRAAISAMHAERREAVAQQREAPDEQERDAEPRHHDHVALPGLQHQPGELVLAEVVVAEDQQGGDEQHRG